MQATFGDEEHDQLSQASKLKSEPLQMSQLSSKQVNTRKEYFQLAATQT